MSDVFDNRSALAGDVNALITEIRAAPRDMARINRLVSKSGELAASVLYMAGRMEPLRSENEVLFLDLEKAKEHIVELEAANLELLTSLEAVDVEQASERLYKTAEGLMRDLVSKGYEPDNLAKHAVDLTFGLDLEFTARLAKVKGTNDNEESDLETDD